MANGSIPLRNKPGADAAFAGPLQVRGGFLVLTVSGIDNAHGLSAPQGSGWFRVRLLQIHRRGLGGIVANVLQGHVGGAPHQFGQTVCLLGLDQQLYHRVKIGVLRRVQRFLAPDRSLRFRHDMHEVVKTELGQALPILGSSSVNRLVSPPEFRE